MSDFLTNLVSRSFGTALVVRPRVSSLFEPLREDAAKFRSSAEMKHGEMLQAVDEEALAENAGAHDQRPRLRLGPAPETGHQPEGEPAQDEHTAQPVIARLPRSVREPQRAAAVEEKEGDDAGVLVAHMRRNAPHRVPVIATITEHEHALVKSASVSPASPPTARNAQPERRRPDLLIPPKLPPEMRIPELAVSPRRGRMSDDKDRNFPSGPLPSEPTVNVTIGRIEVRATKESSHSTRPATPSPVMSLDEYLRNRAQQAGS